MWRQSHRLLLLATAGGLRGVPAAVVVMRFGRRRVVRAALTPAAACHTLDVLRRVLANELLLVLRGITLVRLED